MGKTDRKIPGRYAGEIDGMALDPFAFPNGEDGVFPQLFALRRSPGCCSVRKSYFGF